MSVGYAHSTSNIIAALRSTAAQEELDARLGAMPLWPELNGALYGIAGEFVEAAGETSEADPAALLMSFLTCAAATFGARPYLRIGNQRHPLRLFCVLMGSSRSRRGTALEAARQIFSLASEYRSKSAIGGAPTFTDGPLATGEDLTEAISSDGPDDIESEELRESRPDEAPAVLTVICATGQSCPRIFLEVDDFGSTVRTLQRTNNTLAPMLKNAWDKSEIVLIGPKRQRTTKNAHVCLLGQASLGELQQLQSAQDRWTDLAGRMLWVAVRRTKKLACPKPIDAKSSASIASRLSSVLLFAERVSELQLTAESESLWENIYSGLSQDCSGTMGSITARAEEQVLRLAAIFALLSESTNVNGEHLEAALAVWRYCQTSAVLAFAESHTSKHAARILAALAKGPKTRTELHHLYGRHLKSSELNNILAELQARRLAVPERVSNLSSRGRPTITWRLSSAHAPSMTQAQERSSAEFSRSI